MVNTLLRSGDIKDFKMLGHDGKAAYLVAAQIREMFRIKLGKQYADCLAIPQRNDQGNIIDWYIPFESDQPDGQYDIVPWTSASESEQESALILLKEFEHKVLNFGKQLASNPNLEGDQLLFSRLIYDPNNKSDDLEPNLMAIRFPSNQFVYIVNGKPVITFWGFVYPQTAQVNSPFYCLESFKQPTPSATHTFTEPATINKPWWKRWWLWLLALLPLLLLLLAIFWLRGCWQSPVVSINADLGRDNHVSSSTVTDEKLEQDKKDHEPTDKVIDRNIKVVNGVTTNGHDIIDANGTRVNGDVVANTVNPVDSATLPNDVKDDNSLNQNSDTLNKDEQVNHSEKDKVDNQNNNDDKSPTNEPDKKDENSKGSIPPDLDDGKQTGTGTNPDQTNNLALSQDQLKQGSTKFLDGQWSVGGGIQDKATGKPLQLSYDFNEGNGQVTVTRSDGVKCVGKVESGINKSNLNIASNTEAICSDNSKYQLPKIQCTPGKNNQADCQGVYDNGKTFPITMKKQ